MVSVWLAVATSCGWGNMSYSHFSSVPQVWTWKDTVEFELPVLPAGRMYHFEVGVRYTETFTLRNCGCCFVIMSLILLIGRPIPFVVPYTAVKGCH